MDLADNAAIAGSLGLAESSLSPSQLLRIPQILAKLSADFRRVAGREFTPGTTTVKLLTIDGRLTLPDKLDGIIRDSDGNVVGPNPGVVSRVQDWECGDDVEFTVVGQDVIPKRNRLFGGSERAGTGDAYLVTYTHNGDVPDEVKGSIAAAVGRYLTVDPKSAVAQSTFLSSEGFHQRMAAWVAESVMLDANLMALARNYSSLPAMPVVAKMGRAPVNGLRGRGWVSW